MPMANMTIFDAQAPKRATNVSINSDLLAKARALKINLSATLERALSEQLARQQEAAWRQENAEAIEAYNRFVEMHGCFSDATRSF
mgnify:FL=1|jgi:ccdB antidote ccdA